MKFFTRRWQAIVFVGSVTLAVALTGCEFKATPKAPGIYQCTVDGKPITFDSRDYHWYASTKEAHGVSMSGEEDIYLPAWPGDCEKIGE